LDYFAQTLALRGNFAEAEAIYRRWLALNQNSFATVLQHKGALLEAEQLYRKVTASIRTVWGKDSEQLVVALTNHGSVLQELSDFEKADSSFKEALSINNRIKAPDEARAYLSGRMASLALDRGEVDKAESLYLEALTIYSKPEFEKSGYKASVLTGLGKTLLLKYQPKIAERHVLQALPLWESGPGKNSYQYGLAQAILGRARWQQGKVDEAKPLLREGYRRYVAQRGSRVPDARLIRVWLDDLNATAPQAAGAR
jgi:tetratricopeptide (TPR) repeat protein